MPAHTAESGVDHAGGSMSTPDGSGTPGPQDHVPDRGGAHSDGPVQQRGAATMSPEQKARRKSKMVALGITGAVAAGVVAIAVATNDDEPSHAGVCVDKNTGNRVDDDQCSSSYHGGHYFGWYFFAFGSRMPRVGAPVSGGSYSAPSGSSYVTGGVPREGGAVSASNVKGGTKTTVRGGFGSGSKGSGG